MGHLGQARTDLAVRTGDQLRAIPVEQPYRDGALALGGGKPQVVGCSEQPQRPLELRLSREELAWQARVTDAIRVEAILEEPRGDRDSAHALAKPWVVATRRVGNRHEPA